MAFDVGGTTLKWRVFLINLEQSTDRLKACRAKFEQLGVEFERIPAICGESLTQDEIDAVYDATDSRAYYKELNAGEVGCYLSHRCAWQKIVDEQLDYAFVFEDDFALSEVNFASIVKAVNAIKKPWFYVKLGGFCRRKDIANKIQLGDFDLATFRKVPNRTPSQVVSYEGAQRLLQASDPFCRPVDVDLRYWWEKHIHIQGLLPFPFMPDPSAESEIHKIGDRKRSRKNVLKGWYDKCAFYLLCFVHGRRLKS